MPRWAWRLAPGRPEARGLRITESRRISCQAPDVLSALVPHADHQRIDLRRPQLPAHPVELVETGDRPDAHAMPDVVVHRVALYLGVDPLERELRAHPVGIRLVEVRVRLQTVHPADTALCRRRLVA